MMELGSQNLTLRDIAEAIADRELPAMRSFEPPMEFAGAWKSLLRRYLLIRAAKTFASQELDPIEGINQTEDWTPQWNNSGFSMFVWGEIFELVVSEFLAHFGPKGSHKSETDRKSELVWEVLQALSAQPRVAWLRPVGNLEVGDKHPPYGIKSSLRRTRETLAAAGVTRVAFFFSPPIVALHRDTPALLGSEASDIETKSPPVPQIMRTASSDLYLEIPIDGRVQEIRYRTERASRGRPMSRRAMTVNSQNQVMWGPSREEILDWIIENKKSSGEAFDSVLR